MAHDSQHNRMANGAAANGAAEAGPPDGNGGGGGFTLPTPGDDDDDALPDMRNREVVPGVFVPFPDSDRAVQADATEELAARMRTEGREPDEDCNAALAEGLDAETLQSFRGVRQWVMCAAWDKHQSSDMRFGEAVQAAWDAVDEARARTEG